MTPFEKLKTAADDTKFQDDCQAEADLFRAHIQERMKANVEPRIILSGMLAVCTEYMIAHRPKGMSIKESASRAASSIVLYAVQIEAIEEAGRSLN